MNLCLWSLLVDLNPTTLQMCGGQRKICWVSSTTPLWIPGTKLRLVGLCGKHIYSLNHLAASDVFRSQPLICTFLFVCLFVLNQEDLNSKSDFDISQLHKLNPLRSWDSWCFIHPPSISRIYDWTSPYSCSLWASCWLSIYLNRRARWIRFHLSGSFLSTCHALSFSPPCPARRQLPGMYSLTNSGDESMLASR